MNLLASNLPLLLFQSAPERPFTYGVFGTFGMVAVGIILTIIAVGVFSLFRKGWSKAERAVGVLVLFSIAFLSFIFFAYAAFHDTLMEEEYKRAVERQAERRQRESQTNSNTAASPR